MIRSKFTILLIPLILCLLALTTAIPVQAGQKQEIINVCETWEQLILPYQWANITASEKSYFVGWLAQTDFEIENYICCRPYHVRGFIDGEEVKLLRFSYYDKTSDNPVGEPAHFWFWYHIFEPGYFQPETFHSARFDWTYYNGHGESRHLVEGTSGTFDFFVESP
ncbi:MAG: hypothetical protein ACFFC7_30190 [Candidatus Hermodarchaeota archaeon]